MELFQMSLFQMSTFKLSLVSATLLCSWVAGFLFSFAVVAMPGLGQLGDRDFIRAFQVIDGVIQKNQPIFMAVWLGSIVTLIASAVLGFQQLSGANRLLLIGAAVIYLFGVQLPTITGNIPLNNQIQAVDVQQLDTAGLAQARSSFEPRWNRLNVFRTILATLASSILVLLVLRL